MEVYGAIDPGFNGAVGIIIGNSAVVFDTPTIKVKMHSKTKDGNQRFRTEYEVDKMVSILKPFSLDTVKPVIMLEDVHPMPMEGSVSSFSFGMGKGIWIGVITALFGKPPTLVTPQKWKKFYPDIISPPQVKTWQEELSALRAQVKVIKDKNQKKCINNQIEQIMRSIKTFSKDAARILAAQLYPDISDCFNLKKHDGRAEALLMANYAKGLNS